MKVCYYLVLVFSSAWLTRCNSQALNSQAQSSDSGGYKKVFIGIHNLDIDNNFESAFNDIMEKGFGLPPITSVQSQLRILWIYPFSSGFLVADKATSKIYNSYPDSDNDSVFLYLRDSASILRWDNKPIACLYKFAGALGKLRSNFASYLIPEYTLDADYLFFIQFADSGIHRSLIFRVPFEQAKKNSQMVALTSFLDCVGASLNIQFGASWDGRKKTFEY